MALPLEIDSRRTFLLPSFARFGRQGAPAQLLSRRDEDVIHPPQRLLLAAAWHTFSTCRDSEQELPNTKPPES